MCRGSATDPGSKTRPAQAVACCSAAAPSCFVSRLFLVKPDGDTMLASLRLPSNRGLGASSADSFVGVRRKRFKPVFIAATRSSLVMFKVEDFVENRFLLDVDVVEAGALSASSVSDSMGTSIISPPDAGPKEVEDDGQGAPACCMLSTEGQEAPLAGAPAAGHEVAPAPSVAAAGHSGKADCAALAGGQAAGKAAACALKGSGE